MITNSQPSMVTGMAIKFICPQLNLKNQVFSQLKTLERYLDIPKMFMYMKYLLLFLPIFTLLDASTLQS